MTIPGYEAWRDVPSLGRHSVYPEVDLLAHWDDYRNSRWACPVVVSREL